MLIKLCIWNGSSKGYRNQLHVALLIYFSIMFPANTKVIILFILTPLALCWECLIAGKISHESSLTCRGEAEKYHFVVKFVQPISFNRIVMLCRLRFKCMNWYIIKVSMMQICTTTKPRLCKGGFLLCHFT